MIGRLIRSLVLCIIMAQILTGCGVKGDPVPVVQSGSFP